MRTVALSEVVELRSGVGFPKKFQGRDSGAYPFAKVGDISRCVRSGSGLLTGASNFVTEDECKALKGRPFPEGTVVFAKIGETIRQNFRAVATVPLLLDNNVMGAIPDLQMIVPRYLYRFLQSIDLYRFAQATTVPSLRKTDLSRLPIPLPPIEEQRRIAAVLDAADELRTKRRQALAKLDTLTQAIFIDMFGDPATNPMGWPDHSLENELESLTYGHRFYDESYSNEGTRVVRITDLDEVGNLHFSSMPKMGLSDEEREKYRVAPGDILFARSGATVGKVALIRPNDPECIAGAYFVWMRFKQHIAPEYARSVLTSERVRLIVATKSRQAAQQNFSGPAIKRLPFPVPPLELQMQFAKSVGRVRSQVANANGGEEHLNALFASLQQRAFAGEL